MLVEVLAVAVIGLLAGGVVNALADDLPERRSPRLPHYPDGAPRPFVAWLGITAFLFGKRASADGAKLSWRQPLAELVTAGLMILTLVRTEGFADFSTAQLGFWLAYMAIFVLITVIDIEHKLILFAVIIPSAVLAILDALVTEFQPGLQDALIGGVAGFAIFFIMYNGGFLFTFMVGKLRGKKIDEIAFGYGDVMMATLSGLILGWQTLIFMLIITVLLGALGAIIYLISRRIMGSKYSMFTAIPYGPYIVAASIIMLLYRTPVIEYMMPQ